MLTHVPRANKDRNGIRISLGSLHLVSDDLNKLTKVSRACMLANDSAPPATDQASAHENET